MSMKIFCCAFAFSRARGCAHCARLLPRRAARARLYCCAARARRAHAHTDTHCARTFAHRGDTAARCAPRCAACHRAHTAFSPAAPCRIRFLLFACRAGCICLLRFCCPRTRAPLLYRTFWFCLYHAACLPFCRTFCCVPACCYTTVCRLLQQFILFSEDQCVC